MNADAFVSTIAGHSGPGDLINLLSSLKSQVPTITGRTHITLLQNIASSLDPVTHSLGMLFILEAQSRSGINQGDLVFVETTGRFLQLCSAAQIQLAPETMAHLCHKYKEHVIALGCPRIGISPLLAALRKLQPSREFLTPVHSDFLQLCLLAKRYNAATEVLDDDIFDVDPHKTATTPTDFFLYCYYGGLVAAGSKRYARSIELLLQALTAPAVVANAIVIAAYKKLVLVSLIHTGGLIQLPKPTPGRIKSTVEQEAKAYLDLASAYRTHNAQNLNRSIEQYANTFNTDTSMGLVKQVAASLAKRNIQRLTQTYLTLSLGDIAEQVGLPSTKEAELYVLRMIESGDIHARIDEREGMVRFEEDPDHCDNAARAERIDEQIQRSMQLAAKFQSVHDKVSCDKQYLSKVQVRERSRFDQQQEGDFIATSGAGGSGVP